VVSIGLLWFSLSAVPGVFVSSSVEACSSESFGHALRMVRPDVAIGLETAPDTDSVQVSVAAKNGTVLLTISGHGRSINRDFPDPNDCEAACRTAALIIDRALEDLRFGEVAPPIETLAPPPSAMELSLALGIGATQGMFGAAAAVTGALQLHWHFALLALSGDLVLPTGTTLPNGLGSLQASGENLEIGVGLSPPLGPGRLSLTGLFGVAWTNLSAQTTLPVNQGGSATEPYVGVTAAYVYRLPEFFFLSAQLEEQLALGRTVFNIDSEPPQTATTRAWTFQGWVLVGRRLF
jgi:hypothetical protein